MQNVTTVPLSVCYGALNLLVRVDVSNFVAYACDRAVAGEYGGPESGRTVLRGLSRLFSHFWAQLALGPYPVNNIPCFPRSEHELNEAKTRDLDWC